jgi:LuxR family transcriptional regulator, maltose regulon positive regulatory protein
LEGSLTVVGIGELLGGTLSTAHATLLEALGLSEQQGNTIYARATRGMLSGVSIEQGELLVATHAEGYLRLFLDEGEELFDLLRGLLSHLRENTLLAYARHILNAFTQHSTTTQSATPEIPFLEPLSQQERKVLRLLAAGNSNAAIASELVVSVNTVRTQVQSIYRKLNVSNRVEASAVANQLDLT